jgi:chemotaxis protein MotB
MSVQNPETQPIIIVKKKGGHGGHHGGAWKVAYADFVTAMMAFFMVMWLMNTSAPVKKAIAGYFRDPSGRSAGEGTGKAGLGEGIGIGKSDMAQLKDKLEAAMKQMPELAGLKEQVQMTVTGEGLRIELLEKEIGTFFQTGSSQATGPGQEMLRMLAAEVGKLPNRLLIEGHTDARPFSGDRAYSNWELSSDRANSARRLMQDSGLRGDQVAEVRGFADQRLRDPKNPNADANRRITVIVQYAPAQETDEKPAHQAGGAHGSANGHAQPANGHAPAGDHKPEEKPKAGHH